MPGQELPLFLLQESDPSVSSSLCLKVCRKKNTLKDEEKHRFSVEIVGKENIPQRALDSVRVIGSELVGRPQLLSTVTVGGGVMMYVIRKILLEGNVLASGRYLIKMEDFF